MKKIEILVGSPRKNGNTIYLSNFLNEILNKGENKSRISRLYNYNIKPCIDCRNCKKGKLKCTLKDDAEIIFNRIEKANVLVIASPIYWFSASAKTKLLIDRFRPYFVNKKLASKKAAIILAAGSGLVDCDLAIEMFRRIFSELNIQFLGAITSEAYDIGDAVKDEKAIKAIKNLSLKIVKV